MTDKVLRLDPNGPCNGGLEAIGLSFPDYVVEGDPQESAFEFFVGALSAANVGIWESKPGAVRFESYPFDEVCFVVSGETVLEDESGQQQIFRPGDAFLVRKGFRGIWRCPVVFRKFYVELHAPEISTGA